MFGEEKCTPMKILATPVCLTEAAARSNYLFFRRRVYIYLLTTQVNSAWPSLRGYRRNEYQPRAMTPYSWGVKAGMVRVWLAGKTV